MGSPGPGWPGTHANSGSGRRAPHGRSAGPGPIGRPGARLRTPRAGSARGRSEGGRCRAVARRRGRGQRDGLGAQARATCWIAQAIGAAVPRMRPRRRGASGRNGRRERTVAARARGELPVARGGRAGGGNRPRPGRDAIARRGHVVQRDRATDERRERDPLPVDGTGPYRRHQCADRIDQQGGREARAKARRHVDECAHSPTRRVSRVQTRPVPSRSAPPASVSQPSAAASRDSSSATLSWSRATSARSSAISAESSPAWSIATPCAAATVEAGAGDRGPVEA